MAADPRYRSDRWITPGVIIAALVVTAVLVAVLAGYCAWLMGQGVDPAPLVDLVTKIGTAAAALGTLLLQLFGRSTTTKVERNTGALVGAVYSVHDALDAVTQPAPSPADSPAPVAASGSAIASVPDPGTRSLPAVPPVSPSYYSRLREGAPQ